MKGFLFKLFGELENEKYFGKPLSWKMKNENEKY